MLDEAAHQNPPTGMTPRKRRWEYVDKWERTQSRTDLLRDFRRQHDRPSLDDAERFSRVALPDSDDDGVDENQEHAEQAMQTACVEIKMEIDLDCRSNPLISPSASVEEMEQLSSSPETVPPSKLEALRVPMKSKAARALQEKSTNVDVRSRITRKRR